MRILYLTHRLPYAPNRGDRIRSYHMLRHMSRHHAVDLVSLVHDEEEASHVDDLRSVTDSITIGRVSRVRGLTRAALALTHEQPLTHALLDAPGLQQRIAEVVERARPDLVVAYCSGMAKFAVAPPLRGLPFVLDLVDVDSAKWQQLGGRGRTPRQWIYTREARLLRGFERHAVRTAQATLVVNKRERNLLFEIAGGGGVEVVPNGIDLSVFSAKGAPATERRVVFCGVMSYEPNEAAAFWLAKEVWPLVRAACPDAQLSIVGMGPTRRLRDLPRHDPSIEVTGAVPDVRPYLWRAAVSAAPLAVARGIQNKVLEAAAAGLPSVVTSAVAEGLPGEALPACVRADTPADFSAALLKLLGMRPPERRAIARAASLEGLDWSHRLARLDTILAAAARPARRTA